MDISFLDFQCKAEFAFLEITVFNTDNTDIKSPHSYYVLIRVLHKNVEKSGK